MSIQPTGRQELCPSCDETFSCTYSGDMHRTGKHAVFAGPDRRRCLTVSEMESAGMTRNQRGVWLSPGREEEAS